MIVISEELQRKVFSIEDAMEAVKTALGLYSEGKAVAPVRMAIPTSGRPGTALFMPSLVESVGGLGVKFVSVFPENKAAGKKTIHGVMILSDVETGEPLALLEASYLTMLRTGAASGVATNYLARKDSRVLGVIGTGGQSRRLIDAVMAVRDISEIRLYNRTKGKALQLAEELKRQLSSRCPLIKVVDSGDEAAYGADIIVTATNSATPVLSREAVSSGAHINGVGSFRPAMQEIPSSVVRDADKIVVESREAAIEESGDLVIPIRDGIVGRDPIHAELGEIIGGTKPGRELDEEITFFKSVGLAAMDVVVARMIYDKVIQMGLGQRVNL